MKKIWSLLLIGLIFMATAVSSAFAYFTFTDPAIIDNIDTGADNARFTDVESDFYKVYFFASPYYATGATIDGEEVTDPLRIADSGSKNPYNQDEGYGLIYGTPLTGDNADRYANVIFPDTNNKFYISAESIDSSKLGTYGAVKMWPKKYWSGYILENPDYGVYEKTSTYVSLTVNANIPSDILSDIIAQTVFKDQYGFGPEFIGWTYDMEACNTRVRYDGNRYKTGDMKRIDTRGWGTGGSNDQIGNYGVQGEIPEMTSGTSLYYIDNLGTSSESSDSNVSVDGSLKGDHVIYLYPVFMAKNYDKTKMINNEATPIVKVRVNPEQDEDGNYTYDYKQSGEIDYDKNRFTEGFFQTADDDITQPNYYANDIYIDTTNSSTSKIQNMRLDVNPTTSSTNWADHWSTLLDFDDFKDMGLEPKYYNFYISFWQLEHGGYSEDDQTTNVLKVMESYKSTNKFLKVIGSKRKDGTTYGVTLLKRYNTDDSSTIPVCYVIGIQNDEEYRVTGNSLNGSINNFESASRKRLYRTAVDDEEKEFFISDSISLKANEEISILIEGTTTSTIPYSFTTMDDTLLTKYNEALANSNHTNKTAFKSVGDSEKIGLKTTDGKANKIVCNTSGTYGLMVVVDYTDGVATSISVSYRELDANCSIFILSSEPNDTTFFNYDALKSSDNFIAVATYNVYTTITVDSVFEGTSATGGAMATSIAKIHEKYPGMAFMDTATGWKIDYDLFASGNFILNRNYVLYLTSK